jgi:hypothetical protein
VFLRRLAKMFRAINSQHSPVAAELFAVADPSACRMDGETHI